MAVRRNTLNTVEGATSTYTGASQGMPKDPQQRPWFEYQLPRVIESARQAYLGSYQASAVVAGLFVATEAQVIALIHADSSPEPQLLFKLLLICAYGALIFNIGAVISSLVLIDRFGELPFRNRRRTDRLPESEDHTPARQILEQFGADGAIVYVHVHWAICLTTGAIFTLLEMGVFAWLYEPLAVFIFVTVAAFVAGLPLFLVVTGQ